MDGWGWANLRPWLTERLQLPAAKRPPTLCPVAHTRTFPPISEGGRPLASQAQNARARCLTTETTRDRPSSVLIKTIV
jgi:hypothetical protein